MRQSSRSCSLQSAEQRPSAGCLSPICRPSHRTCTLRTDNLFMPVNSAASAANASGSLQTALAKVPGAHSWHSPPRFLTPGTSDRVLPFRASARVGQPVKVDYFRISLLRRSKLPPPGNSPTPTDGRRHRSRVRKPSFPHDGMVFVERPGAVRPRCFCATTWSLGGEDRSAKSPVRERRLAAPLLLPVAGII